MTKLSHAIPLRDAALQLLKAKGTWAEMRNKGTVQRFLEFRDGAITVVYRTPFQKVSSAPSDRNKYLAALLGVDRKENLPYGLDIWSGRKVLNIEWNDRGRIELVNFKPGPWESRLEGFIGLPSVSSVSISLA